jgi:putative ABC transport system substrate-binding protein
MDRVTRFAPGGTPATHRLPVRPEQARRLAVRSRREFVRGGVALVGLGVLAGCGADLPRLPAFGKVARIGYLSGQSAESERPLTDAFRQGLQEHGYVEDKNIAIDYRFTDGRPERLAGLTSELVQLKPDVIVAWGTAQTVAAKQATDAIPIVFHAADPVGRGVAGSLSSPGTNVTGVSISAPGLLGKRLDLLKEASPGIARVAFLGNAAGPGLAEVQALQEQAPRLGVQVQLVDIRGPDDLASAFAMTIAGLAEGLIVGDAPWLFTHHDQPIAFAAQYHLPAMYSRTEYVKLGGLMSYGQNILDSARRVAVYVDKILRGTNPGDIPIEQPTSFDFAVNLTAAQALGISFPPRVAAQVTEWIP